MHIKLCEIVKKKINNQYFMEKNDNALDAPMKFEILRQDPKPAHKPAVQSGAISSDPNDMDSEQSNIVPEILPPREKWNRKIDFLLACIGFSVGLGNVWRFPYLCYNNGGGAFLIPYFIGVLLAGIPCFVLEVAIGQFMNQGGIEVWKLCPLFKGIGYASAVVLIMLNCYYNMIIAWALYYLFASFTAGINSLPWKFCGQIWNTENCFRSFNSSLNVTNLNGTIIVDPTTEYWERKVLALSDSIEQVGSVKWDLALCLLLGWIIVFFCIWQGIRTSGKVMYFTATTPYLLMLILLIRAATLEGSIIGLRKYLIPEWSKLLEAKVWVDAGTQIFFSYSIALGTLSALGSFNRYNHNSLRDCVIYSFVNSFTSFFAGFIIFLTLGYMSHISKIDIDKVADKGPGLAFVVYPRALAEMPFPALWSVLFFTMLLLLGLDSQFVGVEGFITAVSDIFPNQLRKSRNKKIFILIVCFLSFLIGLSMTTNGGMYVFQIFDYYTGSRIILVIAIFECLVISYIYGWKRISANLKHMYGFSVGYLPLIFWGVISPIYLTIIFIMSTFVYSKLTYKRSSKNITYEFPQWSVALGWTQASSSIVMVPIVAILMIFYTKKENIWQRICYLITPQFSHEFHENRMTPMQEIFSS